MKTTKSEYDIQAEQFAEKTNVTMTAVYTGHRRRENFDYITSVYSITLTTPKGSYTFDFSTSVNDSFAHGRTIYGKQTPGLPSHICMKTFFKKLKAGTLKSLNTKQLIYEYGGYLIQQVKKAPSLYDVLSCLTSYDPGAFSDFCGDFGCDTDSRKAHKTWEAVSEEYSNVSRIFAGHMDELAEIN
jgi:hypothetical protein